MIVDTAQIENHLERARADVAFWEDAKRVLTDPRITGEKKAPDAPRPTTTSTPSTPYSVLRERVMAVLVPYGTKPMASGDIVRMLAENGHAITTKQPTVTVNDALVSLEKMGRVICVDRRGVAKFWTKAQTGSKEEITTDDIKEQTPTEVGV